MSRPIKTQFLKWFPASAADKWPKGTVMLMQWKDNEGKVQTVIQKKNGRRIHWATKFIFAKFKNVL